MRKEICSFSRKFRQRKTAISGTLIGTARVLNRVYETVQCLSVSVRPSVCSIRTLQQLTAGLLQWARKIGDIDQSLQQKRAATNAGSSTLLACVGC